MAVGGGEKNPKVANFLKNTGNWTNVSLFYTTWYRSGASSRCLTFSRAKCTPQFLLHFGHADERGQEGRYGAEKTTYTFY